ncbi:MAG: helix-turn-helix transcriptional regulator [Dehalococcoidia bacterium]
MSVRTFITACIICYTPFMETLKDLRLGKALSQRELARFAGITTACLKRIESGDKIARLSARRQLAAILSVKPEEIDFRTH